MGAHNGQLQDGLLLLMEDIWKGGVVVGGWRDAVILPIAKKEDLTRCENWRGISLLDVAGKVFVRILQDRLQTVAEEILPKSQCGFRKGRGCANMIFAARQLVEKSREHDAPLFVLLLTSVKPTTQCLGRPCGVYLRSMAFPQPCYPSSSPFTRACQLW